nr:CDP-diacylglycerol diphosphatase [uncultured Rhodopila sp.]
MFRWLLLGFFTFVSGGAQADPSALWKIVDGQCVPHEEETHNPAPCSAVDLAQGVDKGTAVLKDIVGIAQFLLLPTARIGGIEDPAVLAPGATNYWEAAWQARHFVDERLHTALPREDVSLAINSLYGRTQDELHIHIDCIRPDVRDALTANLDKIGDRWAPFPVPLAGHNYRAIRVIGDNLDSVNPFLILADSDPRIRADMGMHTLVVAGETFPGGSRGFVLLDDQADLLAGNRASGEQLQDHSCAVAEKR